MKRVRRTYLDVLSFIESFGHILISDKKDIVDKNGFVQSKTKIKIRCEKGHEFTTTFDVYRKGKYKCKKCVQESGISRRKYTFNDIVNMFEKEGYLVKSDISEYKSIETVLNVMCPRGHDWTSSYHNFSAGYKCSTCKMEDKEADYKLKDEKTLIDYGYEVLDFQRAKNNFFTESIFTVKCKNGHVTRKPIKSIRSGKLMCVDCFGKKKKELNEVIGIFESYGYKILSHNGYENNQSRFLISCKNGHKFNTTYASFQQRDKHCCLCDENIAGSSKGEKRVAKFLDNNKIDYVYQYRIEECRLRDALPFDFYLPKYNIAIEFDGVQHYKIVKHFGGLDKFINRKIADTIKNEYCKTNNIKLIRIPYWEFDNIENILNYEIYEKSSTTRPRGRTL